MDRTMCTNKKCPLKETCLRFKAIPIFLQYYDYFEFDNGCDFYLEITNTCS